MAISTVRFKPSSVSKQRSRRTLQALCHNHHHHQQNHTRHVRSNGIIVATVSRHSVPAQGASMCSQGQLEPRRLVHHAANGIRGAVMVKGCQNDNETVHSHGVLGPCSLLGVNHLGRVWRGGGRGECSLLLGDGDHSSNNPRTLSTGHGILECHLTLCHGRRLHHGLAQGRQANISQATSYAQDGWAHGREVQHQEGALQASAVNPLQLQRSASF